MPTDKPRFTITTSKHIFETVDRLAKLQGVSKSYVINDLLEAIHPPLMRTVALLEAAQDAPDQVKDGLRETILDLERELTGSAGSALAQMDWLTAQFAHPTESREALGSAAGGASTPPSNTGVPHLQKTNQKPKKPRSYAKKSKNGVRG